METTNGISAPSPLGSVIGSARDRADLSVRELARKAGVSHSQISRIEAGKVAKPSKAHLVGIARGLNRNPLPLLVLAGYSEREEVVRALRPLFREGAELPEVWGSWAGLDLAEVEQVLSDPNASSDDLTQLAIDIFEVEEADETEWDDSYQLAAALGESATELQEFMSIWRYLSRDLRRRWLNYGAKLRDIADLDYRAEAEEMGRRQLQLGQDVAEDAAAAKGGE